MYQSRSATYSKTSSKPRVKCSQPRNPWATRRRTRVEVVDPFDRSVPAEGVSAAHSGKQPGNRYARQRSGIEVPLLVPRYGRGSTR